MTSVDPSGKAAIVKVGRIGNWYYDHVFLRFFQPCRIKCNKTDVPQDVVSYGWGLYPGSIVQNDGDRLRPVMAKQTQWINVVEYDWNPDFDKALCSCVNKYAKSERWDRWPVYWYIEACGTWARAMWSCAEVITYGIGEYTRRAAFRELGRALFWPYIELFHE